MFPGVSRYRVRVYPYWSRTAAGTGVATNSIAATVPNSGLPPGFAIPTAPGGASVARLQVGQNNIMAISSVAGATGGSKAVTYTLASNVTISTGVTAYANLAFPTTNSNQTITRNSSATPLVLNINAVSAMPEKNGTFIDNTSGRLYDYRTARLVGNNVQLENINWTGAAATSTIAANTYLIFSQSARLDSTGEHLQTQKAQTDYVALFSSTSAMGGPPQNNRPKDLTEVESGFENNLGALDLTKSGNRVVVQGYIATGGTHAYWAALQHLGEAGYRFEDPEQPGRDIGWHVVPIANDISDNLRNSWMQYYNLSYDVQIKNGWDLNKDSGGSGIAFRWHENPLFAGSGAPRQRPLPLLSGIRHHLHALQKRQRRQQRYDPQQHQTGGQFFKKEAPPGPVGTEGRRKRRPAKGLAGLRLIGRSPRIIGIRRPKGREILRIPIRRSPAIRSGPTDG